MTAADERREIIFRDSSDGLLYRRPGGAWVAATFAASGLLSDVNDTGRGEGGLLVFESGAGQWIDLAVGSDWQQLVADASQTAGLAWVKQHPVIALKGASHTNITAATDLTWTTSSLKDTEGFTHSTSTNPAQITIVRAMLCRVAYTISGTVGTAGVGHTALHIDTGGGFGLLDNANCYASMPTVTGRFTIAYSHIHQFAASDIIKVVGNIVGAGKWDFRADESRICLEEIRRV